MYGQSEISSCSDVLSFFSPQNNPQVESEGSSSSVEAAHESGAWVELESETSSYVHPPYRNSGLPNNYRPTTPAQVSTI